MVLPASCVDAGVLGRWQGSDRPVDCVLHAGCSVSSESASDKGGGAVDWSQSVGAWGLILVGLLSVGLVAAFR